MGKFKILFLSVCLLIFFTLPLLSQEVDVNRDRELKIAVQQREIAYLVTFVQEG